MDDKKEYEITYARGEMYKCTGQFKDIVCLTISWGAMGIGVGELNFYFNTNSGKWSYDSENMSSNFCKAVLNKWFDGIGGNDEES